MNHVKLNFKADEGLLTTDSNFTVKIFKDGAKPYDMLLGALGSCFYATFMSIVEKKKLTFDEVDLDISGRKRTEVPTTLEDVNIKMVIKNPSNEQQLLKSAELGAKYCSIYETISKVAKMNLEVIFE
ncbi:MAG TPA: OsmC family protein [Bacilli bacterium]|nr:OsmC family protein [Bacilli bacterium]HQA19536.1 OsmC family protein [Bacilli bacterium]HQD92421.1 OsmC family protein [Bacilli bacterium]